MRIVIDTKEGKRLTAMPPDDVGSPFGCDTTAESKEL
jgi:hypothetical protein